MLLRDDDSRISHHALGRVWEQFHRFAAFA